MTPLMARIVTVASIALLAAAVGILFVGSNPGLRGGPEGSAKFVDAYPIQEGNHVRVAGAVAGEVTKVELGDGTATVHRELEGGLVDVVEVDLPCLRPRAQGGRPGSHAGRA